MRLPININITGVSFLLCMVLIAACVEPYAPPSIKGRKNFLVVDGFVNATSGVVTVNLSRSIPLSDTQSPPPEKDASITLEDTEGNSFLLDENAPGEYSFSGLVVDFSRKYRLNIKTKNNKRCLSDFIEIKESPAIDSINWEPTNEGVRIYVNTHDDTDKTRYYQWFVEETYRYTSTWNSTFKLENGVVVFRPWTERYHECYTTETSSRILIGTSRQLQNDIIREFLVASLPKGSKKIFSRYSIHVKQRAITKQAYEFYDKLKKTTEDLGGLFDPQPGQVMGNIHSITDDDEIILGFFSGGSEQEKRIFISLQDLPEYLKYFPDWTTCIPDSIPLENINALNPNLVDIIDGIYKEGFLIGYTSVRKACTDCRLQGGTTEQPDFW